MDRRAFLTGTVTAAAAGMVVLATDTDVAAFGRGDAVSLSQVPETPPTLLYPGTALFVKVNGQYRILGLVRYIDVSNEPIDITERGATQKVFKPSPYNELVIHAVQRRRYLYR